MRMTLALLLLVACGCSGVPTRKIPQMPHEFVTLPSGLEVVLLPDHSAPLVAVDVWYHVGSADDVSGQSGFAHLFEHMMFQGSKHVDRNAHIAILKQAGATGINGTTNTDRTNYMEVVPNHHLNTALWLESDRMGWLLDAVTQAALDNQREVVRNERRQRYDNTPYGKEEFAIAQLLYPEGHPYRYTTIGRHEDLQTASLDAVRAFFTRWYLPRNATLCLAGDFDVGEAKAAIAKWFGTLPSRPAPVHAPVPLPHVETPTTLEIRDPLAGLQRIHLVWITPAIFQPGDAELDLVAFILGDAGVGRLQKRLHRQGRETQRLVVYNRSHQHSSEFHVIVDLKPGASRQVVLTDIQDELQRLVRVPPSESELSRAVLAMESQLIWSLEGLMNRCELLQIYRHYLGKPDGLAADLQRYRGASSSDVSAVVAAHLQPQRRVAVFTVPTRTDGDEP